MITQLVKSEAKVEVHRQTLPLYQKKNSVGKSKLRNDYFPKGTELSVVEKMAEGLAKYQAYSGFFLAEVLRI